MAEQSHAAADGQFRWYELQTTDAAAAEAFYGAVVGWRPEHMGPQPEGYTVFNTAKGGVAGMMTLGVGEGPPAWVGYVAVDDVDAYVEKVKAAGGGVRQPATDVPGMLRFAGVSDPQGVPFVVFAPISPPEQGPPTGETGEAGYITWHELVTTDATKGFDFYSGLFGWTKTNAFEMGPMGTYQLWTDGRGGDAGGMMTRSADAAGPAMWRFYFQVDGIDAAIARLTAAGGKVDNGPHQVPTGDWVLQGTDPQGVAFFLTSRSR
jgi:predicted enzyme related to lactoylglutathione lyase